MANIIKGIGNIFTKMKVHDDFDDYEDDDYDDYEDSRTISEKPRIRQEKISSRDEYEDDYEDDEEDYRPSFFERKKKTSREDSKVVPLRKSTRAGQEVCVVLPKGFDEVEDICDKLLAGSIVAMNLEALDIVEAQRIVDFVFGTMHAINGKFRAVSKYVYIISPENVELSVENEEELIDTLFEVPVINRQ